MDQEYNISQQDNAIKYFRTITASAANQKKNALIGVRSSSARLGPIAASNQYHEDYQEGARVGNRFTSDIGGRFSGYPMMSSDAGVPSGRHSQKITPRQFSGHICSTISSPLVINDYHSAVESNNPQLIRNLTLVCLQDVNNINQQGDTPLTRAVYLGEDQMVKLLLDCETILVNKKDAYENTPLHIAISRGHENITDLLLYNNADITLKNAHSYTVLHIAAMMGYTKLAAKVIEKIPVVDMINHSSILNVKDIFSATPLQVAISSRHTPLVKKMLELPNIEINGVNDFGWGALHLAAHRGYKEIVQLLIACGDKLMINAPDCYGFTALHRAVAQSNADIVDIILSHPGIDIEQRSGRGETALMMAKKMQPRLVSLLERCTDFFPQ